jgi:hypothetical protein
MDQQLAVHWAHFFGFAPHCERPQVVFVVVSNPPANFGALQDPQGLLALHEGLLQEEAGLGQSQEGFGQDEQAGLALGQAHGLHCGCGHEGQIGVICSHFSGVASGGQAF